VIEGEKGRRREGGKGGIDVIRRRSN